MLKRQLKLAIGILSTLVVSLALNACGQIAPAAQPTSAGGDRTPILAFSELAVGPNRLAIGVLEGGTPVNDPNLALGMRLFYLDGPEKEKVQSETAAVYRGEGLPFGLYVGYANFDRPGAWGLEITLPREGQEPQISRLRLDVLEQSRTPMVGSKAIASDTLTTADVPDLGKLTSDPTPDPDLYQISIADALTAKKPFLVAFSTPGYCETAVCSPNLFVIKQLKNRLKDQVNFIHVEVYPYPYGESFQAQKQVPAMSEWKLVTEPWTFLVDGEGVIQAKYEGGVTFAELEPALAQLAAGEPVNPLAIP